MYYAILGVEQVSNSGSIDIFNHDSMKWNCTWGLVYQFGKTYTVKFRNMIYITGDNQNAVV